MHKILSLLLITFVILTGCTSTENEDSPANANHNDCNVFSENINTTVVKTSTAIVAHEETVTNETISEKIIPSTTIECETTTSPSTESIDSYLDNFLSKNNLNYYNISASNQLIVVDSLDYRCDVYLYEKSEQENWHQINCTSGYLGKNGTSKNKVEGDYCTPAGLYLIGFAFGTESISTKMEYHLINKDCYWVDDSNSSFYNQWIESNEISWDSAEHMIDYPQSYHYGAVINYNMDPVTPNKGSAIFLHCDTGSYTAGCVSVPESYMIYILNWLNPSDNPIIVIA